MIFNLTSGGAGGASFAYTGDYVLSEYTASDGKAYALYTLTSTGLMTAKARSADIWICGGGNGGGHQTANSGAGAKSVWGGAGAYCAELTGQKLDGAYLITIAAAGGMSSVEDSASTRLLETAATAGMSGGTGGGASYHSGNIGGTGDGITKYPFGDSSFFKCHCAGGGGGGFYQTYGGTGSGSGGNGGTNGGNGGDATSGSSAGAGGDYGGGKGGPGYGTTSNGQAAFFYGSGGGGRGHYYDGGSNPQGIGGAGYQGVCYVRIPK